MLVRFVFAVMVCLSGLVASPAEVPAEEIRFELRLAEAESGDELVAAEVAGSNDKVYLHPMPVITSHHLEEAQAIVDSFGNPAVAISLTDEGAERLATVSEKHLGKQLAILVDGDVICAPTIRSKVSKKVHITGNFTEAEVTTLAQALSGDKSDRAATSDAVPTFVDLFNGRDLSGWVNVNTADETWQVKDGLLVCTGQPIGVMRSEKQYENFILHIEWRHMKPGGNSGVFVWSEGFVPEGRRLPKGMEVQMLELEWVNLNRKPDGEPQDIGYISGELFGAGGLTATPDNPRGSRSKSLELRCKPAGEWNTYDVVCVAGSVNLAINGKFVNSIRDSSMRKGYLCLESEGSEIHFRNIRILELPPGITTPEQTAKVIE